ncbi:MAG: mechanosensitive ion channel [Lewinella sp.]|nr:mechanosensitive ion channel [Lewinella sp.]
MRIAFWIIIELGLLLGTAAAWYANPKAVYELFYKSEYAAPLRFLAAILAINITARVFKYLHSRRSKRNGRGQQNYYFGINNIRKILVGSLSVFMFFLLLGVDTTRLFTALSIVAAAIAIVSKEFVNDLLAGLYYSFSDNFDIGDYVKLHHQKGKLIDIGVLKIKLLNDNDDLVILANSKVYAEEMVNYTRRDARLMSVDFELAIKAVRNIDQLEKELIEAVAPFASAIDENSFNLKIVEVKKDYLELKFQYRLRQLEQETQRQIKRQTVRAVYSYVTSRE